MNFITVQFLTMGASYYSMYVLEDMSNVGWLVATSLGPSMVIQFFTPSMMKKFGKRKVFIAGLLVVGVGSLGFGLAAALMLKPAMIGFRILAGLGIGMYNSMDLGIVADIINYTKNKTGNYLAGIGNAGVSAADKLGQGIGSAAFGFAMAAAGFNGALDAQGIAQPAAVGLMVSLLYVWIPCILYLIMFLVFALSFDLEKKLEA